MNLHEALKVFKITKDFSDSIKQRYRALIKKYHPDLNPGIDSKFFHLVTEANDLLRKEWHKIATIEIVICRNEGRKTFRFKFISGWNITLGRADSSDISINDMYISRNHLNIELLERKVRIIDTGKNQSKTLSSALKRPYEDFWLPLRLMISKEIGIKIQKEN